MNQPNQETHMLAVAGPLAEIALIKMREPEAIERVRGCNGVRPILNYVPAMAEKLATGVKSCLVDEESEVQKAAYAAALLIVQTAPKTAAVFMQAVKTTLAEADSEITPQAVQLREAIFATSSKAKAVFDKLAIKQPVVQKLKAPQSPSAPARRAAAHSFNFTRPSR